MARLRGSVSCKMSTRTHLLLVLLASSSCSLLFLRAVDAQEDDEYACWDGYEEFDDPMQGVMCVKVFMGHK